MNLLEQLTDAEEKIRDSTLKPALDLLVPRWVSPNHITMLRAVLVSVAMILYFTDTPLAAQIWVLAAAALTDFVDGPLARLRRQTSRRGAYLDQLSDWFLGAWAGTLVLLIGLIPAAVIALMVAPQIGVLITDRIRASRLSSGCAGERALNIAMGAANFRPTTVSRLQFVAVLLGFMLLLFSKASKKAVWRHLGLACLYLEILLAWLLLLHGVVRIVAGSDTESR